MQNNCDEYTFICSECEGEMSDEPYGVCRAILKCETCEKEFMRLREVESAFIELRERFAVLEKLHYGRPRFAHGCKKCVFLGLYGRYDLYFCPGEDATVVARYGDDGPKYISMKYAWLINVDSTYVDKALLEAVKRVVEQGLRKEKHGE